MNVKILFISPALCPSLCYRAPEETLPVQYCRHFILPLPLPRNISLEIYFFCLLRAETIKHFD